jgi:hypothetical protein
MKHGMTEDTIGQLEKILNDLLNYFTGRVRTQPMLAKFVEDCVAEWSAAVVPRAAKNLSLCQNCFNEWMKNKATKVRDLNSTLVKGYFAFLNTRDISRGTVVMRRGFAKRIVNKAKALGLLQTDPLADLKVKCRREAVTNTKQHGITNDELGRLYTYLNNATTQQSSNNEKTNN